MSQVCVQMYVYTCSIFLSLCGCTFFAAPLMGPGDPVDSEHHPALCFFRKFQLLPADMLNCIVFHVTNVLCR